MAAAKASSADLDDPFSTIRLDADEAASDPNRIADEANTVAMFGGKRLVWVRGSTQRNLARCIEPVLRTPPNDALVIIEAGDLKPTGLRKMVEGSPAGMALPCYADEKGALDTLIDRELAEARLTIEPDAREALRSCLGGDRLASRGEIQKLALYAHGRGTVSVDDVEAVVGDASAGATDQFVDAVFMGDAARAEALMGTLLQGGTTADGLVMALQRHVHMMQRARARMDEEGLDAARVLGALRPPVNFRRKPAVQRALSTWRGQRLDTAVSRIADTAFRVRTQAPLATAHLGTLVLSLARMAR